MKKVLKPFNFRKFDTVADFKSAMDNAGLEFPVSEDMSILKEPINLDGKIIPNRMCIQPSVLLTMISL